MAKSYIPTLPQILMHPISRPKFTFFQINCSTDHSWPPLIFVTMAVQLSSLPQLQQLFTTKLDILSLALLRTLRLVYGHSILPLFLQRYWQIIKSATKLTLISFHIALPRLQPTRQLYVRSAAKRISWQLPSPHCKNVSLQYAKFPFRSRRAFKTAPAVQQK